ncbi:uncharacterized protein ACOB8E_008153 isoform 2-T2 [Sarcophilus harrisii]
MPANYISHEATRRWVPYCQFLRDRLCIPVWMGCGASELRTMIGCFFFFLKGKGGGEARWRQARSISIPDWGTSPPPPERQAELSLFSSVLFFLKRGISRDQEINGFYPCCWVPGTSDVRGFSCLFLQRGMCESGFFSEPSLLGTYANELQGSNLIWYPGNHFL